MITRMGIFCCAAWLLGGVWEGAHAQPAGPLARFEQGTRLASIESVRRDARGVVLNVLKSSGQRCSVRIDVLTDHLVRIRVSPAGDFRPTLQERDGFIKSDWPEPRFTLSDGGRHWSVETAGVVVRVRKNPFQIVVLQENRLLLQTVEDGGICVDADQARLTIESPPEEHFYGFGDQGVGREALYPPDRAPLDHRGKSLQMTGLSSNRCWSMPVFLGSRGYGFFLNMLEESFWDMAKTRKDRYTVWAAANRLDFYVVAGPLLKDILARYTELVGRPPLPPRWHLGEEVDEKLAGLEYDFFHAWADARPEWYEQARVEATAHSIRRQHIACDVYYFGPRWETIANSFEPAPLIKDLERMLALLNRLHFKTYFWQRPTLFQGDCAVYREAEAKGYLVKGPDGRPFVCDDKWRQPSVMVDFTNPAAVRWWQEKVEHLVSLGMRAFHLDSESASFIESYPEAKNLVFHNGMTGKNRRRGGGLGDRFRRRPRPTNADQRCASVPGRCPRGARRRSDAGGPRQAGGDDRCAGSGRPGLEDCG